MDLKQIEALVAEFLAFIKNIAEQLKEVIVDLGLDKLLKTDTETTEATETTTAKAA